MNTTLSNTSLPCYVMESSVHQQPKISIVIKALNEEHKIERCLESAIAAVQNISGEIILVDSNSTDNTVEIAKRFPVRIIQFRNDSDIGCGAAAQLGYQHARGRYIYILDGDMELMPEFISSAVATLESETDIAGIGGKLIDSSIKTPADARRQQYYSSLSTSSRVDHLGGGGLYKRAAIESVGYLANRWLHAAEELDLGLRLTAAGWRLIRNPEVAVLHTGHNESALSMLKRLFKSGRMESYGMLVRYAIGKPWFIHSIKRTWFIFAAPIIYVLGILCALLFSQNLSEHLVVSLISGDLLLLAFIWFLLGIRKKDFYHSAISIVSWHLYTWAAVKSIFKKKHNPLEVIGSLELS